MRRTHINGLMGGLAVLLSIVGCRDDLTTEPETPPLGPTIPQGPTATPPNVAPIAIAGQDQAAECASHTGAAVTLNSSGSSDSDGRIVLFEWFEEGRLIATGATPTVSLGLGTHTILLRVSDDDGGTNDDVVVVTIQDTRAATIQMAVSPARLWPPNHTMHLVSHAISTSDVCDPAPALLVGVASNEPVNGLGDGDTAPDWSVERNAAGLFDVWVRAERSGLGSGRVYTITAAATDRSGNTASLSGTVTVPHDQ